MCRIEDRLNRVPFPSHGKSYSGIGLRSPMSVDTRTSLRITKVCETPRNDETGTVPEVEPTYSVTRDAESLCQVPRPRSS